MALERKDVRLKLDPDDHAMLVTVADAEGKDIGEWCADELLRLVRARVHAANVIATRAAALGFAGKSGDSQGNTQGGAR